MAGYIPFSPSSSPDNFVIDKVDPNLNLMFSNGYFIKDDANGCSSPVLITNCGGVSIVESPNLGLGERYAIAGSAIVDQ